MANYSKRYAGGFVDLPSQITAVDSQFLNAVEASLLRLDGTGASANQVPVSNGTAYTPALLKTANIDPAAGILKSQLASLGIVDADIAGGAAIAASKLASGILLSQLSGYPSDATKFARGDGSWAAPATATQLDYKSITAPVTVAGTTEGTATAVTTGASVTYDGTAVRVEFFAPKLLILASTTPFTFVFLRDSTVLGQVFGGSPTTSGLGPVYAAVMDTPAAGAHTYAVKVFVGATTNTPTVQAGAGGSGNQTPAFMRVTKAA